MKIISNKIKSYIIISIVVFILVILKIKFKDCSLFDYNLVDILLLSVASIGFFYIQQLNDDIKHKNNKIEEIINNIRTKMYDVWSTPIVNSNKGLYLSTLKFIDNKLGILDTISNHLNCEKELDYIKNEFKKIDDFIIDNIDGADDYFIEKNRKDKIPNILNNIDAKFDEIIKKIYSI